MYKFGMYEKRYSHYSADEFAGKSFAAHKNEETKTNMQDVENTSDSNEKTAESLDAPIAAPDHHKVIFEDERVRVMELRVKPGEVVPVHTHRWASINYVVTLSNFLSFDADGNLKLDSRTGMTDIKQGGVFCLPPYPPLHSVENIGAADMHGISIELKD